MIGVINYQAGNAPSVVSALRRIGVPSQLVASPEELKTATHVVLPGVGSADATMKSLQDMKLIEPLNELILEEKLPFLGICVGLQVLFEHSEEGDTDGLGWLGGRVVRFSSPGLRVPQMGWNLIQKKKEHPVLTGMPDECYCYFVNSYHALPCDSDSLAAVTEYGGPSAAIVARGNIVATQFHIEKSSTVGLRMLKNFAQMSRQC